MWVLFFFFGLISILQVFYVRPPNIHTIGYMMYKPQRSSLIWRQCDFLRNDIVPDPLEKVDIEAKDHAINIF